MQVSLCATKGAAFDPWREPVETGDMHGLVHAAVLAANAHNSQPWRFRIGDNLVAIGADLQRHLGSFDPFRREMHQSLGCAIENLMLAAQAQGLRSRLEVRAGALPPMEGDADAAIVHFGPSEREVTDLFRAIPHRRTHRGRYKTDLSIPQAHRDSMLALQDDPDARLLLFDSDGKRALGDVIISATRSIVEDRQMTADNAKWFRFRSEEVDRHRDGLTLDANVSSRLMALAARLFPPSADTANRKWIEDTTRSHVGTAALLGMIVVRDPHERATALAVGRLWQRLHLWLTAHDLAAQPLNQPVERVDREQETGQPARAAEALSHIIGDATWRPAFVFRAGYPQREACFSPRRPVADVVAAA
jgi:hypothetical protein